MIRCFLIFSILGVIFSCSKQEIEPSMYGVQIKNAYFEQIDSVKLGNHSIGAIEQGNTSESVFITKGMYSFSCITHSALVITTEINIQGLNEQIIIKLNEKGKIELE